MNMHDKSMVAKLKLRGNAVKDAALFLVPCSQCCILSLIVVPLVIYSSRVPLHIIFQGLRHPLSLDIYRQTSLS